MNRIESRCTVDPWFRSLLARRYHHRHCVAHSLFLPAWLVLAGLAHDRGRIFYMCGTSVLEADHHASCEWYQHGSMVAGPLSFSSHCALRHPFCISRVLWPRSLPPLPVVKPDLQPVRAPRSGMRGSVDVGNRNLCVSDPCRADHREHTLDRRSAFAERNSPLIAKVLVTHI